MSSIDQVRREISSCPRNDLKKTLRKLQLAWHPDKNPGKEDEAREVFHFVQTQWDKNFKN
jgi:DnaJ-class molecular chaperone